MKFKKGQSGNPAGKPRGAKDKRTEFRELLKPHEPAVVQKLISLAKDGDTAAMRLVLERISPQMRATDNPIRIELAGTTLTEKAQEVVRSIAEGQITPEQGGKLLDALSACARIQELDEMARRIAALEAEVQVIADERDRERAA